MRAVVAIGLDIAKNVFQAQMFSRRMGSIRTVIGYSVAGSRGALHWLLCWTALMPGGAGSMWQRSSPGARGAG